MQRYFYIGMLSLLLTAPTHADTLVGVLAPMTGPAASVSEISLPGLRQAVTDQNAKGGERLKLEILDDACDPKQAVQAANKLAGMHVAAVISVSCSGAAQAAAPVFDEEGLPYIVAVASAPELTKQGYKGLFRPASRDDQDAAASGAFLARRFAGKKVAIIDDKSAWGRAVADLEAAQLQAKGFKDLGRFSLNAGEQDFSPLIGRLKAGGYEVVYPALYMREAGLLVRQMAEQQFAPAIVGAMTLGMQDFLAIVGAAKNGIYFTRVPLTPRAAALAQKLKASNTAGIYNVQAYAAAEILAQALAAAKGGDLAAALRGGSFDTALGPVKFAADGNIDAMRFEIWQHTPAGIKKAD